mmetsp:Transcript_5169/g.7165  ORF Transcript_5169/g.7165 Transcript_5169/m.7165 type:complete len:293 (-) Transcript_5169:264-1142(-)
MGKTKKVNTTKSNCDQNKTNDKNIAKKTKKETKIGTRRSNRSKTKVDYTSEKVFGILEEQNSLGSRRKGSYQLIGKPSIYKNPPVRPSSGLRVHSKTMEIPSRNKKTKDLIFSDHPEFRPNLTPQEVLQLGSFGGTYFRPIKSGITGEKYSSVWKEFPKEWFAGLDIRTQVTSSTYNPNVNKFGVKCGGDLDMWESSGWITELDPYGWFQWYCRFYLGRRTDDDERQIGRANGVIGPKGRFRVQLMNRIAQAGKAFNDTSVSPVIRQTLQHWGYSLTEKDFKAHCKKKGYKY